MRGEDVAAGEQVAHRAEALGPAVDQLVEEARGEPEGHDPVTVDRGRDRVGEGCSRRIAIAPPLASGPQSSRVVASNAGEAASEHHRPGAELDVLGTVDKTDDVAVSHLDTFRRAGRPRRIHQVQRGRVRGARQRGIGRWPGQPHPRGRPPRSPPSSRCPAPESSIPIRAPASRNAHSILRRGGGDRGGRRRPPPRGCRGRR